jgi:hypothetical protein
MSRSNRLTPDKIKFITSARHQASWSVSKVDADKIDFQSTISVVIKDWPQDENFLYATVDSTLVDEKGVFAYEYPKGTFYLVTKIKP